MTLEEHAKAISDAIWAAYEEGFELDNGDGEPLPMSVELNLMEDGDFADEWVAVSLPAPSYY